MHCVKHSLKILGLETPLDWVLRLKDLIQFFQCPAFGLWPEKINEYQFKNIPPNENNVEVVLDVLECWTRGVLDDGRSARGEELSEGLALCARIGIQALDDVHRREWSPRKCEGNTEKVNKSDARVCRRRVGCILSSEFGQRRNDGEAKYTADQTTHQEWSSSRLVEEYRSHDRGNETERGIDAVEQ